jgi:hypothetical protein
MIPITRDLLRPSRRGYRFIAPVKQDFFSDSTLLRNPTSVGTGLSPGTLYRIAKFNTRARYRVQFRRRQVVRVTGG